MVPFGGFHMPVQYPSLSVSQSHLFTRSHASLFDVSHMVQRVFSGPGAARFLQRITPSGVEGLGEHRSTLSCILREDGSGGIVDDTIITRLGGGQFYVVTNAACREKDDKYLDREVVKWNGEMEGKGLGVREERLDGQGLVALQGPEAEGVLAGVLAEGQGLELRGLLFGQSAYARLKLDGDRVSSPVLISRGGYTGEDGFEISIPGDETVAVTEALLAAGPEKVQLAGLGARDSLRLEAGMCLYGHDLDESTTPVEAGLSWIIPKERRTADAGFYGADVIAKQLVAKSKGGSGVERRRVGLIVEGAPAREGAEIVSRAEEGKESVKLGAVTSGCPSPSLGKNIAMGYVKDGFHKAGTEVDVLVRGRPRKAVVAKMPFVPTKYWKGEA
jgi:aminomethyltransferase